MSRSSRNGSRESAASQPNWSRDWFIVVLFALVLTAILARLVYVQVVKAQEYAGLAASAHTVQTTISARRGTIYDRNGDVLASSVEAKTVYCDPTEVTDAAAVARLLEEHLGKEYDKDYQDYYELVTKQGTSFVYIQRRAERKLADALRSALEAAQLSGIHYLDDSRRVYPNGDVGNQVIGYVDVDGNGVSGLEMHYDSLVGGEDGTALVEQGGSGLPIADGVISEKAAVEGQDIVTTIDIKLQQKAEDRLRKVVKKSKAKGGSVTVMDAATGEIYAACSLTKGKNAKGKSGYIYDSGKIWSVSDVYEPGSTFKAITASSVLANSSVTAKTTFKVAGKVKVYDTTIKDYHEHDTQDMSFRSIMAESSNVGTMLAARKVKNSELYETYKKFGFGENPGTDFPGVASGQLESYEDWDGVQGVNVTFGQGLTVTGLQMVRAYGALEQGGTLHVPHFLLDVPHDEAKAAELGKPLNASSKATGKKNAKAVTSLLRSVVTDGTGEAAAIKRFKVVGKTGTAEVVNPKTGKYGKDTIISFAGWLSGSTSDLVCLVTVEKPAQDAASGTTCGGAFADIMQFAIERYHVSPNGS